MTKRRDRYVSGFDDGEDGSVRGIRSATYDVEMVLYLVERFAKERGLLHERVTLSARRGEQGESWTLAELLDIGHEALNASIKPVSWIYKRLQQNEEAARLVVEAGIFDNERNQAISEALTDTLNNHAIIARGFVSGARRVLEHREKEQQDGNVQESH